MKHIKKIVAVLLCLSFLSFAGCKQTKYGKNFPIDADTVISVEDCFLYSGEFVEDGSFEEKEDVAAIKVKNNSNKAIKLARIYITTSKKELFFEITTLPAGATATVLEKGAQTIKWNEKIKEIRVENRVDFEDKLSLHEDVFLLQANNQTINIKNISNEKIDSDIYVYYKNKDADGNYFGGITFRSKADGLQPGEIKQLPASHYQKADSEVLFVDYAG